MSKKIDNWREIRDAFAATLAEKEIHQVDIHATAVLNATYMTINGKFHDAILQIKIDKVKSQPTADEGTDTVVVSDIVVMARILGAA